MPKSNIIYDFVQIIIALCCCCRYPLPSFFRRNQGEQGILERNQRNGQSEEREEQIRSDVNNKSNVSVKDRSWKDINSQINKIDKTCSICLLPNSNLSLECDHFFHKCCLWKWFQIKKNCPNCRNAGQTALVYCDSCGNEYFQMPFYEAMSQYQRGIDHQTPTICKNCSKKQQY